MLIKAGRNTADNDNAKDDDDENEDHMDEGRTRNDEDTLVGLCQKSAREK